MKTSTLTRGNLSVLPVGASLYFSYRYREIRLASNLTRMTTWLDHCGRVEIRPGRDCQCGWPGATYSWDEWESWALGDRRHKPFGWTEWLFGDEEPLLAGLLAQELADALMLMPAPFGLPSYYARTFGLDELPQPAVTLEAWMDELTLLH